MFAHARYSRSASLLGRQAAWSAVAAEGLGSSSGGCLAAGVIVPGIRLACNPNYTGESSLLISIWYLHGIYMGFICDLYVLAYVACCSIAARAMSATTRGTGTGRSDLAAEGG